VASGDESDRRLAGRIAVVMCAALVLAATDGAVSASGSVSASDSPRVTSAPTRVSKPATRRVFVLGLRQRGKAGLLARRVSDPSSGRYRHFLSLRQYRKRFSPSRADRRRVRRYLASRRGVRKVELSSDRSLVLAVLTPRAGRRIFCASGAAAPTQGLCTPPGLRGRVREISAGEVYQLGANSRAAGSREPENARAGAPQGCQGAITTGAFTPNQLSTAYGVDELHLRGLDGSGVRVATLSSQEVDTGSFDTWAQCFGLATPTVRQFAMPGASRDTATDPEETVLDVEALASLAPGLQRITPIFVPLDQSFSNSFLLFMFGALDPSRQGGRLPHILSVSDGVCESRFTRDQLRLGRRLLTQAAALGITTLAASGDLGFQGCFINKPGAMFPSSSPFATSVGGTDLSLTAGNEIADQVVWSTFATQPDQGVGSGGGPSKVWRRPSFQRAPGIGPPLQSGDPTRLSPDVAAMASFTPGLVVYDKDGGGWGIGGGTSAATPLTAAIVALVLEQERAAGRPRLGSLPPLLYDLARGPAYNSLFSDITTGTSSRRPNSAVGQTAAGGAAQPGFDLATGLGSLKAAAFAEAVASQQPTPKPQERR
jgi:subtilase family serine protease